MKKYIIFDNSGNDINEYFNTMREAYPSASDAEIMEIYYDDLNNWIDCERANLNIQLNQPIIAIADLGLWNGRRQAYKVIQSGNIKDCLYSSCDYCTWYVDQYHDLKCDAVHHDGTNYITYRVYKDGLSAYQINTFEYKLMCGTATRRDITRYTKRIGDHIREIYGWE